MLKLVKLRENAEIQIVNVIKDFKNPSYIYVPVLKKDVFKLNDYICKNTYFGEHISSISGHVVGIEKILIKNKIVEALKIENDFKENSINKKNAKTITSKEMLMDLLKEYSLNSIYEKIINVINIKNLIISSIDEEEYSLKEFSRLSNNYTEVLDMIDYLINILCLKEATLVTKNTSFKSIRNVKSIKGTYPTLKVILAPDKYLISYKEFLCEYLNISQEETLHLTTTDIYDIYNVIIKGKDITENLITVSGNALEKSFIINVRLYTSLQEILDEYIKIISSDYEIFINGYLKGKKIKNINDVVITKDISSIVINKKEHHIMTECINCGACQRICPYSINIKKCYFNKLSHKKCIGCGLCEYICPAKIKLKEIVMSDDNEKL